MEKLLKIFSCLVVYKYNFNMLHWKSVGLDFDTTHEMMTEYSNKLGEYIDDFAEIIVMSGGTPLDLYGVLNLLKEDSDEILYLKGSVGYNSEVAFKASNAMFDKLIELYEDLCEDEDDYSGDIIGKIQEHLYWFRKESTYKLKARLN